MPQVSIIIPTYNRADLIAESIQSVLDQVFQDFELIIVDDGSTDNTKEVIDSYKDHRIRYIHQENRGVSAARNIGIKASSSEYIAFLDSDDMWLPEFLKIMVNQLGSRPDVALVCSDFYVYDDATGTILGRWWHDKNSGSPVNTKKAARFALKYLLGRGCFIALQASLVRRTVFTEVGYFDESLINHVDWDIFLRIVKRFAIETVDIPLILDRRHKGERLTTNTDRFYEGAIIALNKALSSYSLTSTNLRLAKKRLARAHMYYAWKKIRMVEDIPLARKKLLVSIRINWWSIWPYLYLAFSLLGEKIIRILKSWKRWLNVTFKS